MRKWNTILSLSLWPFVCVKIKDISCVNVWILFALIICLCRQTILRSSIKEKGEISARARNRDAALSLFSGAGDEREMEFFMPVSSCRVVFVTGEEWTDLNSSQKIRSCGGERYVYATRHTPRINEDEERRAVDHPPTPWHFSVMREKRAIGLAQFELRSVRSYRELQDTLIDHLLILHYPGCHAVSYSLSDSIMLWIIIAENGIYWMGLVARGEWSINRSEIKMRLRDVG